MVAVALSTEGLVATCPAAIAMQQALPLCNSIVQSLVMVTGLEASVKPNLREQGLYKSWILYKGWAEQGDEILMSGPC